MECLQKILIVQKEDYEEKKSSVLFATFFISSI